VEGGVQRSADRVKVIVQLIRAADNKYLWSNTYEREIQDVFATQEEIAASITNALRLKLGVRRRYTDNLDAFELYLRGRYTLDQRPAAGPIALQYFEQAAARDATYPLAYIGIANAVLSMEMFQPRLPYGEAHRRAMGAVERALALDPALSDAYTHVRAGSHKGCLPSDKSSTICPEHEKKGRIVSANRSGPTQCSVSEDYTHNVSVLRAPLLHELPV
jgi:hypothetical protein